MKKLIITSLIFVVGICANKALAQSFETTVEMKSGFQNAISVDLPNSVDEAEATLSSRFAKSGLKGKSASKGFTEYKDVKFFDFTPETVTIYTKVEKSKNNKGESKVYILVSLGGVFCTSATREDVIENVKKFADNLEPHVALYSTNVQFTKNTDELKKAEKDLRGLQDDAVSLQKDKDKLLKKIEDNLQKIENKKKEVEMKNQIVKEVGLKKAKQESELPK